MRLGVFTPVVSLAFIFVTSNSYASPGEAWAQAKQNKAEATLRSLLATEKLILERRFVGSAKIFVTLDQMQTEDYAKKMRLIDRSCLQKQLSSSLAAAGASGMLVSDLEVSLIADPQSSWGSSINSHQLNVTLVFSDSDSKGEITKVINCDGLVR